MTKDMTIDVTKLVDVEVDGIDMTDYPDFCDAFISSASIETDEASATYRGTDGKFYRELTEDELEWVTENEGCFVNEMVFNELF